MLSWILTTSVQLQKRKPYTRAQSMLLVSMVYLHCQQFVDLGQTHQYLCRCDVQQYAIHERDSQLTHISQYFFVKPTWWDHT